jgi:chromosome segregation ATPase
MRGLGWGILVVAICGTTILVMSNELALPVSEPEERDSAGQSSTWMKNEVSHAPEQTLSETEGQVLSPRNEFSPNAEPKELAEKVLKINESLEKMPTPSSNAQKKQQEAPVQSTQPTVQETMMSIDTMDLDQPEGNWLNKRIWWERAKDKYKECREVFEAIFASRMGFLENRSDIEKTVFDPFYREIGLEQADVKDVLDDLISIIVEERQEAGYLDEKARIFRDMVTAAKKDIEQLKLDIDAISNIDNAIDTAVNMLSNKINEAQKFEQSAWDEFDAIARELSDKRAYERYYVIDGIHKNLKDLQKYINEDFNTYFNGLVMAAQEKTERAKKEIKNLKDHGIDLEEQAKLLVSDEQAAKEEAERAAKAAEQARKAAEAAKTGILGRAWAGVVGLLKGLWNLLFGWWLYRL